MSNEETETPRVRTLSIPDFCMVLLIGASGSGKSTFAAKHFLPTESLSSDRFRGLVSDDENSLEATSDAFDALHHLAAIRLRRRKLVVIDATNVQPESRRPLLKLALDHDALTVAIVLNLPEGLCQERNRDRPDRQMGPHVVRNQSRQLRQSLKNLRREGIRYVHVLNSPEEIESVAIERTPLWTDRRSEHGPFDIIGDVHGCSEELAELLGLLGYGPVLNPTPNPNPTPVLDSGLGLGVGLGFYSHPEGRRAIFLGDLVDRGPGVVEAVRLVMAMAEAGTVMVVPGNHDIKLMRHLQGKRVNIAHGLEESIAQIERMPEEEREHFKQAYVKFVDSMVSHYLLDEGKLVVAHAGMKEAYQGRSSARVRDFAIWGDTTGETDEFGLPVRYPWAAEYRGQAMVVYGHTPVPEADWLNRTINIDTGCVFGGKLSALRYPEREIVQVPARRTYAEAAKPFLHDVGNAEIGKFRNSEMTGDVNFRISKSPNFHPVSLQWQHDELLDAADFIGKRIVSTRLAGNVMVQAENGAAAFEVMSRFAVEPRWLIYLPPTMSPSETTSEPGYLEYPREAFAYFREQGVPSVVCQTKHMGSRAVVVICRDEAAAQKRFGASDAIGECFTRTGRRFFDKEEIHKAFLDQVARAVSAAGLWEELETDWLCLDAELMPWNAKAQALLREQYAPVGAAAVASITAAIEAVRESEMRGVPIPEMESSLKQKLADVEQYRKAYAAYCWDVDGLEGVKLAPFHLLASEGKTYFDRPHDWHGDILGRLAEHSSLLMRTEFRSVDLLDDSSQVDTTAWWTEYTSGGGEGMVVKPEEFVVRGSRGLVQPAVKVRGREYLRIIYGPEYTEPQNLERLRRRSLGAKRSLAAKEFALGVEGLERFVRREPLRRIHECAFAVLALESEPVDPRL